MKHFNLKILLLALTAVMLIMAFASCGGKEGTLIMATNAAFPPYEFMDGDKIVGIDAEIMQAICDDIGMKLEIENMEFDSIIPAIQSGKADVGAAGMTITEDRLLSVSFSTSYTTAYQVIIVPEGSSIAGPDDLKGKIIGVQLGTTGDLYMTWDYEEDGLATVDRYSKGNEAVMALTQGKVDAVVIDSEPAKVFVDQNTGLSILPTEYIIENYALAISKDNTELLDKINASLAKLTDSGKLQKIIDKYIKAD